MLNSNSIVKDMRGCPTKVGDNIVHSFRQGSLQSIRTGVIVAFHSVERPLANSPATYARVKWLDASDNDLPTKLTSIKVNVDKRNSFVKVTLPEVKND